MQSGRVTDVVIQGDSISGHFQDGRSFTTYAPYDPNLVNRLTEHDVRITAQPLDESMPSLLGVLVSWFPMLLLIGVWVFFMRQMQSGGGKAMGFGKSRARLLTEKHGRVAAAPHDEPVVFQFSIGRAGQTAVLNLPILGTPLPSGQVAPVENGLEPFRNLGVAPCFFF